jgi:hypothetical protein
MPGKPEGVQRCDDEPKRPSRKGDYLNRAVEGEFRVTVLKRSGPTIQVLVAGAPARPLDPREQPEWA